MSMKKIFIAGLFSVPLIFSGGQVMAQPPEAPQHDERNWNKEPASKVEHLAKHFADNYDVDASQIEKALNEGYKHRRYQARCNFS